MNRFLPRTNFLFPFLLTIFGAVQTQAQKWTTPTPEELSMTEQSGAPDADAVFLYHEDITDDNNGTSQIHNRVKILKPGGDTLARIVLQSFLPTSGYGSKVSSFAGRTIHPDGTVVLMTEKPEEEIFQRPNGKSVRSTYHLPQPEVGSILEYRYTIQLDNHISPPTWDVQRKYYVRRAHYEWLLTNKPLHTTGKTSDTISTVGFTKRLPPGVDVLKGTAGDSTHGTKFELDATDIPAIPKEDLMPPASSFVYRVSFHYLTADSIKEFWSETGKHWSEGHIQDEEPGDAVKRAVAKIALPTDTPEEKARKIYAAIMKLDNLNVDRALGRPQEYLQKPVAAQTVNDVLAAGRGSNDQINSVFVAMVRAAGISAYVMRVANRDEFIFDPNLLTTSQLDDDITIVELGGKEVFLDPGTRFCPFGHLGWRHAATSGLRQTKTGTEIAQTPPEPVDASEILRVADLTLDGEGQATGILKLTYFGTATIDWYQIEAAYGDTEVRKRIKEQLEKTLPTAMTVDISSMDNMSDYEKPLTIIATVKGPTGLIGGTSILTPASFFETHSQQRFQPEARILPVHFQAREFVRDTISLNFSTSLQVTSLPEKTTEKLEGGSWYELSFESTATSVTIRRNYALAKLDYPISDYPSLRTFYAHIAAKDQDSIVLKRSGDPRRPGSNSPGK